MKKIIITISLFLTANINSYSQLPESYPYKTFLGNDGFLYVTGYFYNNSTQDYDILIEKNFDTVNVWSFSFMSPYGNDKGMDIIVTDDVSDIYITGYLYNQESNKNDIVLLKYNSSGLISDTVVYNSPRDDKGLGITVDEQRNIYISGYITNKYLNKDFAVFKYSPQGNLLWKHEYNNRDYGP